MMAAAEAARNMVLDATCLCHFARIDRIDLLEVLLKEHECHLPSTVAAEIQAGLDEYPTHESILTNAWLRPYSFDTWNRLQNLERWMRRIGVTTHDLGEAGVLAAAEDLGGVALIDDRQARRVAARAGVEVHGTIWLLGDACARGELTLAAAGTLIDDLSRTGMRLPCSGADFPTFARSNGLICGTIAI